MEHTDARQSINALGLIEILNDLGLNVAFIDRTYYVFAEFEVPDPSIDVHYISLKGINITKEIENALHKEGYTDQMRNELFQKIGVMKYRRRDFSPNLEWKKYLADV